MKKHILLANALIVLSLAAGCASTGSKNIESAGSEKQAARQSSAAEAPPAINNIRISDFTLGAGDSISVEVYRHDDLKKSLKVDPSGVIMFPLIGDVKVAGKSIFKVRDEIQERLSKYVINPQVTINVTTAQSQKIIILGEVNSPGVMPIDSDIDIIEAISRSGGLTEDAKSSSVLLIKKGAGGSGGVQTVNLKKIYKEGDMSGNIALQGGDIIYVPAVEIANVSWFFSHLSKILSPIVNLESGIVLVPQVRDTLTKGQNTVPVTVQAR